jgi:hypothetical protein
MIGGVWEMRVRRDGGVERGVEGGAQMEVRFKVQKLGLQACHS